MVAKDSEKVVQKFLELYNQLDDEQKKLVVNLIVYDYEREQKEKIIK